MSIKLLSPLGHGRTNKILVAASIAGVQVELVDTHLDQNNYQIFLQKNPFGKVPTIETAEGPIFESNAILRYIARLGQGSNLYGTTPFQHGLVDAWLDANQNELEVNAVTMAIQVLGYVPADHHAFKQAFTAANDTLKIVNEQLGKTTFITGANLTIADIALAQVITFVFTYIFDEHHRNQNSNILRWLTSINTQPVWLEHFGRPRFCKHAFKLPKGEEKHQPEKKEKQPAAEKKPQQQPKQEKPKAEKPKEDKDEEEMPKKKVNALDLLPASPFNLDDYKRAFFLEKDIAKNMENLFQQIDAQGWSLWELKYNKTENQGKQLIQTCNLNKISLMQKIDPNFKKYSFAIQGVYGQEPNLEIMGAWLWRGVEIPAEIKDLDSFEYLTLTKVDLTDPAAKQQWAEYWINQNEDEQSVKGLLARNLMYYR